MEDKEEPPAALTFGSVLRLKVYARRFRAHLRSKHFEDTALVVMNLPSDANQTVEQVTADP